MASDLERLKITTVGDGMVGKTCMLMTYAENEFPRSYLPTVFDNYTCSLSVDGKQFELTLWDTAGQEDFDRLRELSYPNTECFLICYSISSPVSFKNVTAKWIPEIQKHSPNVPIVLVATKSDLRVPNSKKFVTQSEGMKLKQRIEAFALVECSAINQKNLEDVFMAAVRAVVEKPRNKECICI